VNRIVVVGRITEPKVQQTEIGREYATFEIVSERGGGGEDRFMVVAWDEKSLECTSFREGDFVRLRGTVRITDVVQIVTVGIEGIDEIQETAEAV
jgi:DNA polymerase III alpha subunit (gram-positive type)